VRSCAKVVDLLSRLEENVKIIQRRGIDFADFPRQTARADKSVCRTFISSSMGGDYFSPINLRGARRPACTAINVWVQDEAMATATGTPEGRPQRARTGHGTVQASPEKTTELHEVKDLDKLFGQLEGFGLSISDYFPSRRKNPSAAKCWRPSYAFINEGKDDRRRPASGSCCRHFSASPR